MSERSMTADELAGWKSAVESLEFWRYMAAENRGITFEQSLNAFQDGRAAAFTVARDAVSARIAEMEYGS